MAKSFLVAIAVGLCCAMVGCQSPTTTSAPPPNPDDPGYILAEGDGVKITKGQLDAEVPIFLIDHHIALTDVPPGKFPVVQTAVLDELVATQCYVKRVADLNITGLAPKTDEAFDEFAAGFDDKKSMELHLKQMGLTDETFKERLREGVMRVSVLNKEAYKDITPTQDQLMAIYQKNPTYFQVKKAVRVSRILVHADDAMLAEALARQEKIIQAAAAKLKSGMEFPKVVELYSEDAGSRNVGGDLGLLEPGESEDGFDDVAFRLKVGQTSPIFRSSLGFEIIRVTEIRPAGMQSFSDAQEKLTAMVMQQVRQEETVAYQKKLIANAHVVYHFKRVEPDTPTPQPQPGQ